MLVCSYAVARQPQCPGAMSNAVLCYLEYQRGTVPGEQLYGYVTAYARKEPCWMEHLRLRQVLIPALKLESRQAAPKPVTLQGI